MRRFHLGLAIIALPVFAFTLFLAGCGKEKEKDNSSSTGSDNKDVTKPSGEQKPLEAKNGQLKGEIRVKAAPADLDKRTKDLQAAMEQKDKEHCLADSATESEKTAQTYRIGANNLAGNVFVWLLPPDKNTYFKISDKQVEEAKKHPVKLHQPHCAFIPHCAVLFTKYRDPKKPSVLKPTGQILMVKNDAKMSHNTKWDGGYANPVHDQTLQVDEELKIDSLKPADQVVRVSCTIHTWMDGYVKVFDHPYATVSLSDTLDGDNKVKPDDKKFGTFEMKDLPVGPMRVVAWHEAAGYLNKDGGKGQPIEIKEGKPTEVNFDLEAK